MNCCDEYGNCNQGRDCPARKCPHCFGLGYDSSGQQCICQIDKSDPTTSRILAWVFCSWIALMLVLMTIRSCA